MSGSPEKPWSNNPNAPQIPYLTHLGEKANFAGCLISPILYGIATFLFFQCMGTLLNPVDRTRGSGGIKWGHVAHTVLMFSFLTINTAMSLDFESTSYVDNRGFPGNSQLSPGPYAYQVTIHSGALYTVPDIMFLSNQWLGDGLLLLRCYVIYGANYWVIAFPCLMYLATFAAGVEFIYRKSRPDSFFYDYVAIYNSEMAYFWISLALNTLLTLIIVVRLVLHTRDIRDALGIRGAAASRLHKTIIVMVIESFAIHSIALLLYTALYTSQAPAVEVFNQVCPMTQVIAPFLITVRVAKRRAVTSNSIKSENLGSIHFMGGEESAGDNDSVVDVNPAGTAGSNGKAPGESVVVDEKAIEEVPR